ncbi:MAG: hypothetical protein R3E66_18950 [bacterium]
MKWSVFVCLFLFGCGASTTDEDPKDDDGCETSQDYPADQQCRDSICLPDLCANTTCERGECSALTGECINAAGCTTLDQNRTCLQGFECETGKCVPASPPCEDVTCTRGVCLEEYGRCGNAPQCEGVLDCMDGFVCVNSRCIRNICETERMCVQGVCDPSNGVCRNAEICTTQSECTDGFYCVDSTCQAAEDLCDCQGSTRCVFVPNEGAKCVEKNGACVTGMDCSGDRICVANRCIAGDICVNDRFEPLQSQDFDDSAEAGAVDAVICPGDQDDWQVRATTNTLLVSFWLAPRTLTGRDLQVEIVDAAGRVVHTQSVDREWVEFEVGVVPGDYTVRVLDAFVRLSGTHYQLFVKSIQGDACAAARTLTLNRVATSSGPGTRDSFVTSCGSGKDEVWQLDITAPKHVRLVLNSANPNMRAELRRTCEASFGMGCALDGGPTVHYLTPGRYFVIVEGPLGGDTSYSLLVSTFMQDCVPNAAVCVSTDESQFCDEPVPLERSQLCPSECDFATGVCPLVEGDTCSNPQFVSTFFNQRIDFAQHTNQARGAPGQVCKSNWSTVSREYDRVFRIYLAPNDRITASSSYDVAWTLAESCEYRTCAGFGIRNFSYLNETDEVQEFFLIGNSWASQDVAIEINRQECEPNTNACLGNDAVTCDYRGVAQNRKTCSFGCSAGSCNEAPNESCATAYDLANGPLVANTEDFKFSSNCAPAGYFKLTAPVGSYGHVTMTAQSPIPFWPLTDCQTSCLNTGSVPGADIEWVGDGQPRYFGIHNFFSFSSSFEVTGEVLTPFCQPGENLGCANAQTLTVCDDRGLAQDFVCQGPCNVDQCGTPMGQICADAYRLSDQTATQGIIEKVPWAELGVLSLTCLNNSDQYRLHAVDLTAGQVLMVSVASDSPVEVAVLDTCVTSDATCLTRRAIASHGDLEFVAPYSGTFIVTVQSETVGATYELFPRISQGSCSASTCQGSTLKYCNAVGQSFDYQCAAGCADGACLEADGSSCFEARPLYQNGLTLGQLGPAHNGFEQWPATCGSRVAPAQESIFFVDVAAGDRLVVELLEGDGFVARLDGCDVSECQAAGNRIDFLAEATQRVFVVVDGATAQDFLLSTTLSAGNACLPGTTCVQDVVQYCDDDGQLGAAFNCPGSCGIAACALDPNATDACAALMPPVSDDVRFEGDFADYTNAVSDVSARCTGSGRELPDVVIPLDMVAGDVVDIHSSGVLGIHIQDNCVDGQCVKGTTRPDFHWQAPSTGTHFLVLEGLGQFTVDLAFSTPTCVRGDSQCLPDGVTLRRCGEDGLEDIVCESSCVNGHCEGTTGRTCGAAKPLVDGDVVFIDPDDYASPPLALDPPCQSFTGPHRYFAVELASGENLHIKGSANLRVALLDRCSDDSECLVDGVSSLDFTASNAGTYFLVATAQAPAMFQVEVSSRCQGPPVCAYGTLSTCDAGLVSCGVACATSTACASPVFNDSCTNPQAITTPFTLQDNLSRYSNQLDVGASCVLRSTPGPDAVYPVALLAGETLSAHLTDIDRASLRLAISDTCAVTQCLAYGRDLEFTAPADGTYFMVVDGVMNGAFELEVSKHVDECVSGTTSCADATTLNTCVSGRIVSQSCDVGCSLGACMASTNTTCATATAITPNAWVTPDSGAVGPAYFSIPTTYENVYRIRTLDPSNEFELRNSCASVQALGTAHDVTLKAAYTGSYILSMATPATFVVQELPVICMPGTSRCRGDILETCVDHGTRYQDQQCILGCSAGACGQPQGEVCADAVDVSAGGTFPLSGRGNDVFAPPTVCYVEDDIDTVFKATLNAGQALTVTTPGTAWIASSCEAIANGLDPSRCLAGMPGAGSGPLVYQASSTQTVFIVVEHQASDLEATFVVQ